MKIQFRNNVFETNSSSTHSLSICTKNEWKDFMDGKTLYSIDEEKFVPVSEVEKKLLDYEEEEREYILNRDYWDFESFGGDLEMMTAEYTTSGGETVVAYGYFGYDY